MEHQRDLRRSGCWRSREANKGQADLAAVRDLMARIQANVVNMDPSGRQSMANFAERQTGDAVVTYENELLLRGKEGEPIPYVIPPCHLADREPRGDRRELGGAARQPGPRGGVPRVPALGRRPADLRGLRIPARQSGREGGRATIGRCPRSSSRWPIWEAGPRSRRNCTAPRGSGPTIAAERSADSGEMTMMASQAAASRNPGFQTWP